MEPVSPRLRLSDHAAWAIFATGIVAMVGVFIASEFGDHGSIPMMLERRRLLRSIFFAISAFAISGPLAATIGSWIAGRARRSSGKKQKAIGLEDL